MPAVMALLGGWNWYLPSWLDWLPELHVEGRASDPAAPGATRTSELGEHLMASH